MNRPQFIARVIDEITEGNSIPAAPKMDRINTIIDTALRHFWEYDEEASEFEYVIIPSGVTNTPLFRERRQIKMGPHVESVIKVYVAGQWFNSMNINPDYRRTNFNLHNLLVGDPDNMLYSVMAASYQDFLRNFHLVTVTYEYNPHSNMLTIRGRNFFRDLIAECYVHMCEDNMFEMDRFFRYVCAKCKISFRNIYGFVDQKVLGGAGIDLAEMKSEAKEELGKIEREFEEQRNDASFFTEY